MSSDIYFIDKKEGRSSYDVIRELARKLGRKDTKGIGHAGTLDPMASGLLIVGVDNATKMLSKYQGFDKTYLFEILLGFETETGDLEGRIIREKKPRDVSEEEINKAILSLRGALELPVPRYSAVKVSGEPLYKKARRGERVDPPVKKMEIKDIKVLDIGKRDDWTYIRAEARVSSGTYIRSLGSEIGLRLRSPATVSMIRRTRIGDISVSRADISI